MVRGWPGDNAGIFLIGPLGTKLQWNLNQNSYIFIKKKWKWKCHLHNGGHFVSASITVELNESPADQYWLQLNSSPLDKMATILAGNIFKCIFLNENHKIPIQISLKIVPRSPIDNKPALVQVMAWRRTGDMPLPELMLTQFTDAYMRH